MEKGINYEILNNALDYYIHRAGFMYSDVSWLVNDKISNITKPFEKKNFFVNDKVLVASAEQSFLQKMLIDNSLEYEMNYVAMTPCFRDEKVLDDTHQTYFMKVELFSMVKYMEIAEALIDLYIRIAKMFFESYGLKTKVLDIGETYLSIKSYDIVDKKTGIELGSYAINRLKNSLYFQDCMWICGTGVAEPRLSYVISRQ